MTAEPKRRPISPHAWVPSTYFAEGWPYTLANTFSEYMFVALGQSLQAVGATALFHLPWNLKFLWGPYIDNYETKRRWLIATELVLCVIIMLVAVTTTASEPWGTFVVLFVVLGIVSATHDIAVDGYYLEPLDEEGQAKYVGYRAAAYRVATVVITGPLLVVAGVAGWFVAWLIAAVVMGLIAVFHFAYLPRVEKRGPAASSLVNHRTAVLVLLVSAAVYWARNTASGQSVVDAVRAAFGAVPVLGRLSFSGWISVFLLVALIVMVSALGPIKRALARHGSDYANAFVDFLEQTKIRRVLAFVVLFRVGESFLMKMRYAFFDRVVGMSEYAYGVYNGTLGFGATVVATLLGGYLISRHGLRRWMWPFVVSQNLLNLLFMVVAMADDPSALGAPALAGIIVVEHFGEGLGTAVFMVYIMRCCDPRHKAAHMAILTALMSIGYTMAGAVSGDLAAELGFANYFGLTFLATIPGMALLFVVPHVDGRERSDYAA